MPSTSAQNILRQIETIVKGIVDERNEFYLPSIAPRLSTSITVNTQLPAASIDVQHPLVSACIAAVEKIHQFTPTAYGCGPANEGYMLIESGIPTICGFGPTGGNVHGVDEWISVPSMTQTVDVYTDIVVRYCHL